MSTRFSGRAGAVVESLERRSLLAAAAVSHIYELNGNLADTLGGPSMVSAGGTVGATGYTFAAGQGPNVSNAVNADEYSLEVKFRIADVLGYRAMVYFNNRVSEEALYDLSGKVTFYNGHGTGPTVALKNNTNHHLVITREASTKKFTCYIDAVKQFEFTDTLGVARFSAANKIIHLFRDNGGENAAGFIDQARIYNGVLTPAQVTSLKNGGQPPGISASSLAPDGTLTLNGTVGVDTLGVTLSGTTMTAKVGAAQKNYAASLVKKIIVNAGGGNDTITIGSNILLPTTLKGEAGNDTITGGGGVDLIDGGTGADVMGGGGGSDTADYSSRTAPVNVHLDGYANDGGILSGVLERDNVKTDIENVNGGSSNDVIYGSAVANKLLGNGGADQIFGLAGNDTLDGGAGDDDLFGGAGDDQITGGTGVDQLLGEDGNDTLFCRDSIKDLLVDGGAGTDKSQRDAIDAVLSIESFIA